ncbi:DMT family transporter [Nocardioides marmorisolisilvae]|uniref:DMT family transporter n=1 Tax=Nocardioides marmorisolisilvae TaxID=1542737 RepID=A0A3N0DTQ0_9ACTN|nr:DMT family transporter [Nocardioides marmorisolisilvae]RNL79004.1 DMT family transporter [Nocardioides marmorisolisilvae]
MSTTLQSSHGSRAGEAAMLVSAVAYGISTTVSVAALHRIRPADLVAVELAGAAVVLVLVGLVRGTLTREGARRNFAIGALMPGLAFVLGDSGLSRTSATAGSLLLAAELPMSVLLALLFLHERLRGWGLGAMVLGLFGSTVVALGGDAGGMATTLGNLLVVASVSASAIYLVLTRTFNGADGLGASTWQTVGAAVCTSPFVLIGWSHGGSGLATAGWSGWAFALAVLASTAIGSVAFNFGISRVPGVRASQLLNLTPVVGLLAAIVFLRESPSILQYAGGALVLLAVAVLVRFVEADEPAPVEPVEDVVRAEAA